MINSANNNRFFLFYEIENHELADNGIAGLMDDCYCSLH